MNATADDAVKPTVIDLDPDQVVEEARTGTDQEAAPAAAPPPRKKAGFSLGLPAMAALLVIGGIGGGWLYRDALSAYFPSDQVRTLTDRVDILGKGYEGLAQQVQAVDRLAATLTADVNALEASTADTQSGTKAATEALASLRSTVAALETALAETKSGLSDLANRPIATGENTSQMPLPQDLADRLAALEKDVAALKARKGGALDTAALSQTLADLKAKIAAGVAFADENGRLARMVPAAAGLDVLATHAEKGLPNAKGLATELAALTPSLPLPAAAEEPAAERSYWDQAWDALSAIITIRDAAAINWQAEAGKAAAFAEADDLAQAIATLDATETALPAGLQQWRDRAAARLTLEAAVEQVSGAVARTLSAGQ